MRSAWIVVGGLVGLALAPGRATAQTGTEPPEPVVVLEASPSELAARAALLQTPVGAVPPIATSTIVGEPQKSVVFSARYGYVGGSNDFSFNNGALTLTLPIVMGSTVSLTGGALACNNCGTAGMAGIGADIRIHEWPFPPAGDAVRVLLGATANLGYGWSSRTALSDGSVYSAALSLPISFVSGTPRTCRWCFVPFLAPGIGFGSATASQRVVPDGPGGELTIADEHSNGTRFVIGGGLAIYRRGANVGLNFGAQYIATEFHNVMVGLGLNYGGW